MAALRGGDPGARDVHARSRSSRRCSSSCRAAEARGLAASRSRPTRPSRTGRWSGTRRRSSSSRRRTASTRGLGFTYAPDAAAKVVDDLLAPVVRGRRAGRRRRDLGVSWERRLRNAGRPGHRVLRALGRRPRALGPAGAAATTCRSSRCFRRCTTACPSTAAAASARTTTSGSASSSAAGSPQGIPRVKMKLGREPERDPHRLDVAREAIGDAELYVDANGAFTAKEAVRWAERYAASGTFAGSRSRSRPTTSDGLRLVREQLDRRRRRRRVRLHARRLSQPGRERRLPAGGRHALRRASPGSCA